MGLVFDLLSPDCHDSRPCFGKMENINKRKCRILIDANYKDGECPFCKPIQSEKVKAKK